MRRGHRITFSKFINYSMYYPPGVFEHDIQERPARAPPQITLSVEAFMAHEIDLSTGKPAIAYVEETPWHGLGERLPQNEPIEVWIKAAGLNWELKRLPVQYLADCGSACGQAGQ